MPREILGCGDSGTGLQERTALIPQESKARWGARNSPMWTRSPAEEPISCRPRPHRQQPDAISRSHADRMVPCRHPARTGQGPRPDQAHGLLACDQLPADSADVPLPATIHPDPLVESQFQPRTRQSEAIAVRPIPVDGFT
jgi:hypothetical protein